VSDEERAVLDAAIQYYWHDNESVDFHNDLIDAVQALLDAAAEPLPDGGTDG
jgi:hypothetical protein